jgi:hypothetical protein
MSVEITHHLFTIEQYDRMIDAGILTEADRDTFSPQAEFTINAIPG